MGYLDGFKVTFKQMGKKPARVTAPYPKREGAAGRSAATAATC